VLGVGDSLAPDRLQSGGKRLRHACGCLEVGDGRVLGACVEADAGLSPETK
jgi:hypothetical protein